MNYQEIKMIDEQLALFIYPFSDYVLLEYKSDKLTLRIDLDKSFINDLVAGNRIKKQVIPVIALDIEIALSSNELEQLQQINREP